MAEFVNYGTYSGLLLNTSSTRSITISVNYYTGNIVVTTGDIAGSTAGIISDNTDGSGTQFLSWFANVPINYPSGYEGSTPPDSNQQKNQFPILQVSFLLTTTLITKSSNGTIQQIGVTLIYLESLANIT